jgi:hypothetical protein
MSFQLIRDPSIWGSDKKRARDLRRPHREGTFQAVEYASDGTLSYETEFKRIGGGKAGWRDSSVQTTILRRVPHYVPENLEKL